MDCSSWNVFRLKNMPSGLKKTLQKHQNRKLPNGQNIFLSSSSSHGLVQNWVALSRWFSHKPATFHIEQCTSPSPFHNFEVSRWLGVGGEVSQWSPLIRRDCCFHWFFSFVQVFSILFALPAIGTDFVHELGTTRDLKIPCSANVKRTAEVSWVEEGKDPISNKGLSSQVQFTQDVLVCWRGWGESQWSLGRHWWWKQAKGGGRENSGRIKCGLGAGGGHENGGVLWRHELFHFELVEQWTSKKQ